MMVGETEAGEAEVSRPKARARKAKAKENHPKAKAKMARKGRTSVAILLHVKPHANFT